MSNTKDTKRIAIIGKFNRLYDEEYIARSFEMIGYEVLRLPQNYALGAMLERIKDFKPEVVIWGKFKVVGEVNLFQSHLRDAGIKTVCWVFDLYWGYAREHRVKVDHCFKADYIFSTDGGHSEQWKKEGFNHQVLRQGIFKDECYIFPNKDEYGTVNPYGIAFVGSESPVFPERTKMMNFINDNFSCFIWYGRTNTDELRGKELNKLYTRTKIIVGDSFYSPYYWSNRVVETLGRGGFLIHQEVEGIKEEYPYLVTYKRGNLEDLQQKIEYYLKHEDERLEIIKKNFKWVRDNYTCDKKCAELLKLI